LTFLKKYGVALGILLVIIGLVTWAVMGQLSKPDRTPASVEVKPAEVVEKEFTATPDADVTVETNVSEDKKPAEPAKAK